MTQLTPPPTRLAWTDDYETKFESEKSVITR